MSNKSFFSIHDLHVRLNLGANTVHAVEGVSFEIARNETFALLGESGCGKSITALGIMRLLPDAGEIPSGSVFLDGVDLLSLPEGQMRTVRGKRIAMIFQEPMTSLNPVLTVGQQVTEVLSHHFRMPQHGAKKRAFELLEAVGISDIERRYDEYPFQLSGGMKQRVMVAMALAGEPDLLIADEPTTALDVTIQAQVLELLRDVQKRTGMALLLITHDLGVVAEMAHRVAVMYAGQLVEVADRGIFFSRPYHPYSRKLFGCQPQARASRLTVIPGTVPDLHATMTGCRFAPRCNFAWEQCREEEPGWTHVVDGQDVRCHLARLPSNPDSVQTQTMPDHQVRPGDPSPVLLETRGLKIHFPIYKGVFRRVAGYVKAVDGVSVNLRHGETAALVGESGCGKTTVGKGILQLLPVTAGEVHYAGTVLSLLQGEALRLKRAEIQIVFQDPYASLNPRMLVGVIIEEGIKVLRPQTGREEREKRIDELLVRVGLSIDAKFRYPHEFSGGQRQRIAIARALAVEPRVIICDEPTSALDVSVQAQILNLLMDLQQDLGLAYLFITHNLAVVKYLARQVYVMYLGRIVEQGSVEEVFGNPRHPYTQALLSAAPVIDPHSRREVIRLHGELPSPIHPPSGCHFHPRCAHAMPICFKEYPSDTVLSPTHGVRCHLYQENPGRQ